jgi:hypothetical protein
MRSSSAKTGHIISFARETPVSAPLTNLKAGCLSTTIGHGRDPRATNRVSRRPIGAEEERPEFASVDLIQKGGE